MISFELSEEQAVVRASAADFAVKELRPIARRTDREGRIDDATLDRLWSFGLVQAVAEAAEAGENAGQGAILSALAMEEFGWGDASFALAIAAPLAFVRAVAEQGSAEQKQALLPLFRTARFRGAAVALTEPGLINGGALMTQAAPCPGGFRLNGRKIQIPLADRASHFLAIARNDGLPDAFIVPADAAGVEVEPSAPGLGLLGLRPAAVRFADAFVPAAMRLGGETGAADIQRILDGARVGATAILTGICRGVYEHSSEYAKDRVVHGAPLAQKQSVAFRLVDMFVETEATRWLCWRAATHLDKHGPATRSAALARLYAGEQSAWITDEGVQLMGGHGFVRDNPVERWYRNAKTLSLHEAMGGV